MNPNKREAIAARLDQIARLGGGLLTPSAVLEDAKSEDSPLHAYFEWDDSKAALQHRLDQARELIRSVKIEIKTTERTVSTVRYVHDPRLGHKQGYVDIATLRTEKDLARDALLSELQSAKSAFDRARDVAAVLELSDEIEKLQLSLELVIVHSEAA